jgi:hypothetical protein
MAIDTDAGIIFWGTADSLEAAGTSGAVANAAFSDGTTDLDQWTNTDDAPLAIFVLEFTLAAAGTAGTVIDLYARPMNIGFGGAADADVPDANFPHMYLGSFPINNPSTDPQIATFGMVGLPNVITSQPYIFYIRNNTGQSIDAGWDLTITPMTFGPHA